MSFLELLRAYLEHLDRGGADLPPVDPKRAEEAAAFWLDIDVGTYPPEFWSAFASWFVWLMRDEAGSRDPFTLLNSSAEIAAHHDILWDAQSMAENETSSPTPHAIAQYAFELRLSRRTGERTEVGEPGRIFLRLPGGDAIRWLMVLEAEQSLGPRDVHRISQESFEALTKVRTWDRDPQIPANSSADSPWTTPPPGILRLKQLDVVKIDVERDADRERTTISPRGPFVQTLADAANPNSAWRMAARAALADETLDALSALSPTLRDTMARDVATAESRAIAHEIRNALVPVRVALDALYRYLPPGEPVGALRTRVDAGVTRVFKFVDDRLRLSRLIETEHSFEVNAALRDVVAAMELEQPPELGAPWRARGSRRRFITAVSELVRNARLHSETQDPWIRSAPGEVQVEDRGSDIPEELRDRIFDRGFTTRPEGTGLGLALVKEIVEDELSGTIRLESGWGNNFKLTLPVDEEE